MVCWSYGYKLRSPSAQPVPEQQKSDVPNEGAKMSLPDHTRALVFWRLVSIGTGIPETHERSLYPQVALQSMGNQHPYLLRLENTARAISDEMLP